MIRQVIKRGHCFESVCIKYITKDEVLVYIYDGTIFMAECNSYLLPYLEVNYSHLEVLACCNQLGIRCQIEMAV